jgi:PAS domain S-box-containing protein
VVIGEDGKIALINAHAEKLFGYRSEELLQQPVEILIPEPFPKCHPEFRSAFFRRLEERIMSPGREVYARRKDGTQFPVEIALNPIEVEDGKWVLASIVDTSERKRVEQALREHEEKLDLQEKAIEGAEEMILVVDREYRYVMANRAYLNHRKMTNEQVVGRLMTEVLDEGIFETIVKEKLDRCFRGEVVRYEMKYARPEGGTKDLFISYLPVHGSTGVDRVACIVQDVTECKKAERALRDSEEKFRTVFQGAPTGMVMLSPEGRFLAVNKAFCEFLGYSERELLSMDISSITHPEDKAVSYRALDQALAGRSGSQRLEKRYLHKNGQVQWGELSTDLIWDNENKPNYFVSQIVNITERKRVEEALRANEDRLRVALDSAQLGTFDFNPLTGDIVWDAQMKQIWGIPPGEKLDYANALERIHAEDRERVSQIVAASLAPNANGDYVAEYRIVRPDGTTHWTRAKGRVYFQGEGEQRQAVRMVGVQRDITERNQAEQERRESEERFRLVANAAPVMIWMSGPDKLCIYFNQPWLEFTGRSLEAELGNGWVEGVHPDDLPQCVDTYNESFDRRLAFRMEYRLRRHDGEYRWINDIGVPIVRPDGTFTGYIGSCIDITDLKRAEEILHNISGKLIEAQEKERRRIARELHDDINQRLVLLGVSLQQLTNDLSSASVASLRERTNELSNHVSELSSDIQLLSHQLHSSSLQYLGLVPAMNDLCKEIASRHNVKVDCAHSNVPSPLPPEVALGLFRVLQEALRNAVKHSGVRKVEVRLLGLPGEIQLTIRDRGKGFDPKTTMAGQGLGLVSMQERVHLLKGSISIVSKPMCGTEIIVHIPSPAKTKPGDVVAA